MNQAKNNHFQKKRILPWQALKGWGKMAGVAAMAGVGSQPAEALLQGQTTGCSVSAGLSASLFIPDTAVVTSGCAECSFSDLDTY